MSTDRLEAAKKKFSRLLKEIFQFDCADLDFGIYRVLALRRHELEDFLDNDLIPQVEELLAGAAGDRKAVEDELAKLEETLRGAGMTDFSNVPKWQELKGRLAAQPDVGGLAREVFSNLTTFFSRYYDEGDFLALPRYKGDTYAIPYDGTEVKLHWANADQYYIKTTEQHADYRAELVAAPGLSKPALLFKLAAAESDRDNNKSSEKRRYVLRADDPVEVDDDSEILTAWFEYKVVHDSGRQPSQKSLCEEAEATILDEVPASWKTALSRPAKQNDSYTQLGYQLYRYTKKNTSDYFIHKDLGGFLRRELDFFIKNEVLFLDDLEGRSTSDIEAALRKVRALRGVGGKIIDWLSQLEDLQKRLYLKKKFVLKTDWAGFVGDLPPELQRKVRDDRNVRRRWNELGFGLILSNSEEDDLPFEVSSVHSGLKLPVLHQLRNAGNPAGLLINGDNFHALRLLRPVLQGRVSATFIDPPYNTGEDRFLYKDGYPHSTWLSMFRERLTLGRQLLTEDGVLFFSLDAAEAPRAWLTAHEVFGEANFASEIIWEKKKKPSFLHRNIGKVSDFIFAYAKSSDRSPPFSIDRTTRGKMTPLNNAGNSEATLVFPAGSVRFGFADRVVDAQDMSEGRIKTKLLDQVRVKNGRNESVFRLRGEFRYSQGKLDDVIRSGGDLYVSKLPFRVNHIKAGGEIKKMKNLLSRSHYNMETNEDATSQLEALFGDCEFKTAKPEMLIRSLVSAVTHSVESPVVMDFFAGSGTTAHAVIEAARAGLQSPQFVLVEMGSYFDDLLVPRVLKVSAGTHWKAGQLARGEPYRLVHKILYLESYDDTLENIAFGREPDTDALFNRNDALREDYTLRYMLDLESRGSLLNLEKFRKPWDYTIKVRKDGVVQDSPVDLVETFNYLLGLRVQRYDSFGQDGLLFVTGTDPDGRRVIVVWRDCDLWDNEALEKKCKQAFEGFRPDEFDVVYVNGDHHLPIIRTGEERWKVNLTEETFHALMFDTSDVE